MRYTITSKAKLQVTMLWGQK